MTKSTKPHEDKILVIGDAWFYHFIIPEGNFINKKQLSYSFILEEAAERLSKLINAAVNLEVRDRFIPHEPQKRFFRTEKLREYELKPGEEDTKTTEKILKKCIFKNPFNPFRREDNLCNSMLIGLEKWKSTARGSKKLNNFKNFNYWVIYENNRIYEDHEKNLSRHVDNVFKELLDASKNFKEDVDIPEILWHPMKYEYQKPKNTNCDFGSLLFDEKVSTQATVIRKKTTVFLSMDLQTVYRFGKRIDLSLEECLDGVITDFNKNNDLKQFLRCKEIVISCGIDFAFLIKPKSGVETTSLGDCDITVIFRPERTDSFYRSENAGYMDGYGLLMIASYLRCLICSKSQNCPACSCCPYYDNDDPKGQNASITGIKDGFFRMFLQFHLGYLFPDEKNDNSTEYKPICEEIYRIPYDAQDFPEVQAVQLKNYRSERLTHPSVLYRTFYEVTDKQCDDFIAPWLLEQQLDELKEKGKEKKEMKFLESIVRYGLKNLIKGKVKDVRIKFPIATFGNGNMTVVDVEEITTLRSLYSLMRKYRISRDTKPLGLAVFGAPGDGKSHGVLEVAKSVFGITKNEHLKLVDSNLAQFDKPDDLSQKLLKARDLSKGNSIPLIFLDEFDSKLGENDFGWFKYLLPLLQDGTFYFNGNIYDLPKSIVICAGGLNRSFLEFGLRANEKEFIDAKGPDLISRLRGYVNMKGPNPYSPFSLQYKIDEGVAKEVQRNEVDNFQNYQKVKVQIQKEINKHDYSLYKIRRAVLVRSVLELYMESIISENGEAIIEPSVLNALLNVPQYNFGIRSIQAIIDMSVPGMKNPRRFTKGMIPSMEQLEIHVDAVEFYRLLNE